VVDTKSTAATTQFTRETIELLPTSRNGIVSLLAQAPGVRTLRDVGGSSLNQVPTFRAFGQAGEAYSTFEGVQTSSLQASSGQANYWDYTALEEASVKTLGNSAEVLQLEVDNVAIVKSGSNEFHSSTSCSKSGPNFQSDNIDDELRAQRHHQHADLANRYSISSDIGGRIIRDKLWFYTAGRRQIDDQAPLNTFTPDGSLRLPKSWRGSRRRRCRIRCRRQQADRLLRVQPQVRHLEFEPVHSVLGPQHHHDAERHDQGGTSARVVEPVHDLGAVRLLELRQPLR
jgi:hypothetical protein